MIKINKIIANKTIVFASSNKNKLHEVQSGLATFGIEVVAPESFLDVEEDAGTYFGNARLKADAYGERFSLPCLADDSGIEVSALGWEPGIYSARFAGPSATSEQNNKKLSQALADFEDRHARMRSVLCLRLAAGSYLFTEGLLEGIILDEPRGRSGWGFEPLFCISAYNKSIAQLRDEQQHFETHRTRALEKMGKLLTSQLEDNLCR